MLTRLSVPPELLRLQDLPTLPPVIMRILDLVEDEETSGAEIAEVLEQDHAISLRLLRLANSAFYGLRSPVDTIQQAVLVLGFETVRELALSTSMFSALSNGEQTALDPEDFWLHSLGAAKTIRLLGPTASGPSLFTSALVHDVGKFVLSLAIPDKYQKVVREAKTRDKRLEVVEAESLGYTSQLAGSFILRRWNFPEPIVVAVQYSPSWAKYSGAHSREVKLVALADCLSSIAGFGTAGDPTPSGVPKKLARQLDLDKQALESLERALSESLTETREFFDLLSKN